MLRLAAHSKCVHVVRLPYWQPRIEQLQEQLFDQDALWGYFVKGAPAVINFNIATSRGLVNGCPARMDSITLAEGESLDAMLAAAKKDGLIEIEIPPPLSVNVTPELPDQELAILRQLNLSIESDRVVLPVTRHQLDLAFAVTDFKLQGTAACQRRVARCHV